MATSASACKTSSFGRAPSACRSTGSCDRSGYANVTSFKRALKPAARVACALSVLLVAVAAAASTSLKTIEPVDIVDLREVSDPQISPDGKLIVYSVLRRL